MNLKQIYPEHELPRERLIRIGPQNLTDKELLAVLLGTGNSQQSVLELATNLLSESKNCLNELGRMNFHDLICVQGMGPSKASSLLAAFELGKRKRSRERELKKAIKCSNDAYEILQEPLADLVHEEVWALLLSRRNAPISIKKISEGGFSGTVIDPKKIFHIALQCKCSHLILAHNHPSGNLTPSQEDINVTEKLVACGRLMELQVLDHLIITDNGYYSFADEGRI